MVFDQNKTATEFQSFLCVSQLIFGVFPTNPFALLLKKLLLRIFTLFEKNN